MEPAGQAIEAPENAGSSPRFWSIVAWSVCLGVGSGSLELLIFWVKCHILDPRNMNVSRHMVWMFPMAGLLLVGGLGVFLGVISRIWRRGIRPVGVLFVLFSVAYVGILFRAPVFTLVCVLLATGLAWKTAWFLKPRLLALDRWVRRGACVSLGLLIAVILASYGREAWNDWRSRKGASTQAARSKNVILVVMDTVRAESLGLYGYPRNTSPRLTTLASEGIRFDRAYSTAPWTAPSHASMFTGRWPHEMSIGWDTPLDQAHPTLAEVLGSRGYATAGFVANTTYCSDETGLARGFNHYEDYDVTLRGIGLCSSLVERSLNFLHKHPSLARLVGDDGSSAGDRKDASRINRDFLGWLDTQSAARPFFAFLNYYDAHHPYLTPERGMAEGFGREPTSARDFRLLKTWWERDKQGLKPEDLALARDSYDRCIASLDEQLGRLFDELKNRGVFDDSIVIVTADHGEHLGEHDLFGHGCSVYSPELHVPLLIVAPKLLPKAVVVEDPVSLRDLPATVTELLGLGSTTAFPGRSLARTKVEGSGLEKPSGIVRSEIACPPEDDPNRGRSPASKGAMTSIISDNLHYIRAGDGLEELFDLKQDPGESRNLAKLPEMMGVLGEFRARLRR